MNFRFIVIPANIGIGQQLDKDITFGRRRNQSPLDIKILRQEPEPNLVDLEQAITKSSQSFHIKLAKNIQRPHTQTVIIERISQTRSQWSGITKVVIPFKF